MNRGDAAAATRIACGRVAATPRLRRGRSVKNDTETFRGDRPSPQVRAPRRRPRAVGRPRTSQLGDGAPRVEALRARAETKGLRQSPERGPGLRAAERHDRRGHAAARRRPAPAPGVARVFLDLGGRLRGPGLRGRAPARFEAARAPRREPPALRVGFVSVSRRVPEREGFTHSRPRASRRDERAVVERRRRPGRAPDRAGVVGGLAAAPRRVPRKLRRRHVLPDVRSPARADMSRLEPASRPRCRPVRGAAASPAAVPPRVPGRGAAASRGRRRVQGPPPRRDPADLPQARWK